MTTAKAKVPAKSLPTSTAPPSGPTGEDKEILQQLDRIGNKTTPTDSAEKAAAFEEIEELRRIYGETKVDNLITELGATNGIVSGDVLGAYIQTGLSSGPGSALTSKINTRRAELAGLTQEQRDAAEAAVALNKEDKLKKNEVVVPPDDQSADIDSDDGASYINLTSQTHQCILQHYIKEVAEFHRGEFTYRGRPRADINEYLQERIAPNTSSDQAKIILVDDNDPDSSVAPINALTSLGKTTGLSKLLPADLAKAMPRIRLYKIYREKGEESSKIEFIFPTKTDPGFLTNNLGTDSAGSDFTMTAGYAKGRAAGIKSFDWSFVGGDPFTATRDLTAKLTIFFQDFRDLTMVRQGRNLLKDNKSKRESYKYLDLIVQPDCSKGAKVPAKNSEPAPNTTVEDLVFNPDCYEIAVEVGYANAPGLPLALKNMNDTFYLTMVEHSFDIGQDGTFSLSIDYRARLATLLGAKGMNVLSPGGGYMIKDDVNSTGLVFDIRKVEQELEEEQSKKEPDKTELDALKAVRDHLLYVRNNGLYRSITNTLLTENLIYKITLDRELYDRFTNFADYDREGGKNKLVGIDDAPDLPAGAISRAGASDDVLLTDRSVEYLSLPYAGPRRGEDLANWRRSSGMFIGSYEARNLIRDNIHFTTVGNLITVALDHIIGTKSFSLGSEGKVKDLKKIHMKALDKSPVAGAPEAAAAVTAGSTITTVDDYRTANIEEGRYDEEPAGVSVSPEQKTKLERFRIILGSLAYEDARDGKMKAINIAHLPVSMQMFRQFMIDRVISNQRKFYSLQDFVRDLLTDIVFDSLQRICFGGITQNTQLRTGISLFNGQGTGTGGTKEPISDLTDEKLYGYMRKKASDKAFYKSLSPSAAKSNNPIFTNISSPEALDFNYLMFSAFSVATLNKNLHGDEKEDNDNGIAHFRYGSTTGMMKSINFTKTPLEFAAEERYLREGTDNLLNQLAGRYEMQMSLAGNNMFIPGQYVYFDPVALGIGKSMANDGTNRSLANLMGLGGYHIITEVGCSIAPGKFETTIKALWETGGTPKP